MSLTDLILKRNTFIQDLGKGALNIAYPNEFEVYMCALEVQDQVGNTLQYFIFPVMPSSIDEVNTPITNIRKTAQGIVVLSSTSFNPTDINLTGSFGRKFRILLGKTQSDLVSGFKVNIGNLSTDGNGNNTPVQFSANIKTGYGCIKILQDIIDQVNTIDTSGVKKLILYNLALGNNYIVEPTSLRFSQSQDSNMIWNYSLQLKSVMPLDAFLTDKELQERRARLNLLGVTQKSLNTSMSKIKTLTSQIISSGGKSLKGQKLTNT